MSGSSRSTFLPSTDLTASWTCGSKSTSAASAGGATFAGVAADRLGLFALALRFGMAGAEDLMTAGDVSI